MSLSGAADGVSDATKGVLQGETLRPVLFVCSAQEQLMVCPMPEQKEEKARYTFLRNRRASTVSQKPPPIAGQSPSLVSLKHSRPI